MATVRELEELYREAMYRELIEVADKNNPEHQLLIAWAHHQLGEYPKSMEIFRGFTLAYSPQSREGESGRRGLAHGLLQTGGDFGRVEELMGEIPASLDLDNVYMNAVLVKARKGEAISVKIVMERIMAALGAVPYKTKNGHIVNNGALTLHEARGQDDVKPYLSILPGLILAAIGIYEATGTAKNHTAGAMFRASVILDAAGWKKNALIEAQGSVALWQELVASQGGERYQRNLEGAQVQLDKLTK